MLNTILLSRYLGQTGQYCFLFARGQATRTRTAPATPGLLIIVMNVFVILNNDKSSVDMRHGVALR